MFEISSLIQKALRRSDAKCAYYAANELYPHYRGYLWKRLLCVSAEDCYDMATSSILSLMQNDEYRADFEDTSCISSAVGILLSARKNRDADYFACNLLNSRDRKSLAPYVDDTGRTTTPCPSKNGHDMFDLAAHFCRALDSNDAEAAGYSANELYQRYRGYLWDTLIGKIIGLGHQSLTAEGYALRAVDNEQQGAKNVSTIYIAKAIVLALKTIEYKSVGIYIDMPKPEPVDLSDYDRVSLKLPDYVYDCHTYIGKLRKKTKRDFVEDEQRALRPYVRGEYDSLAWDRYFRLCEIGFYDAENLTPRPKKDVLKELNNGTLQLTLFE